MRRGFTLIELLVVIAIVAVLAVTVILTLNPAQLLAQARDSSRIASLRTLNSAIGLYQSQTGTTTLGIANRVYVSVPDSSPTCANLGLPALSGGAAYACVSSTSSTRVDGTGWVPVNLGALGTQAALSALPLDPTNATSSGLYFTYMTGSDGTWKLSAAMQTSRYVSQAGIDGGTDPVRYEQGSDLQLATSSGVPGSPVVWLAADALSGYANGAQVLTWPDSSGSGNAGTGQGATKPTYIASAVNGKPAIQFGFTGYYSLPSLASLTQGETFLVLRADTDAGYSGFNAFSPSSENGHYSYYGSVYDSFGSTVRYNLGNPPGVINAWHLYNASTAPGSWIARKDGVQFFSTGTNTVSFGSAPNLGRSMPAGVPFSGAIAEMLIYPSVLSTTTRTAVEGYLQAKYGI